MKKLLFVIFLFTISFEGYSQFDNKATIYGFTGVPFMGKDRDFQTESIFSGYAPIPYFGVILQYALNQHIHFGVSLRQLVTKKPNYLLSNTGLGLSLKYNFIPADKPISPFISLEPNLNFTHLTKNFYETNVPVPPNSTEDVTNYKSKLSEPKTTLNIFPVGANIAIGTDFTLKKKFGLFIALNYFTSNAKGFKIVKENFPKNESSFKYFSLQAGIKFSFLRSKNVY